MEKQEIKKEKAVSDHLANERTFLAWIRTSIAMMGFGFVVVKFALFIKQLSVLLTDKAILPGNGYSSVIGVILVVVGAVMALLGYIRYRNIEKQLKNQSYFPSYPLTLILTISIVLISILLIIYLLPSI